MDEPTGQANFDKEFLEKLEILHDPNPAKRSPTPIMVYLDVCSPLNYHELFGYSQAIQASPIVTSKSYHQLMIALLGHVARNRM